MKRMASLILASMLASPIALAKPSPDEETTAALVEQAKDHAAKGDKAGAVDRWEKAYRLSRSPAVGLELAQAAADAGQLVRALTVWRDVATTRLPEHAKPEDEQAVATAARGLAELEAKVPRLRVDVQGLAAGQNATVTLAGNAVPAGAWVAVDPGTYKVEATAEGKPTATQDVTLAAGARQSITLDLAPPPPKPVAVAPKPAPKPAPSFAPVAAHPMRDEGPTGYHPSSGQKTFGLITFGAGIIGLGVGGVTGYLAKEKRDTIGTTCIDYHCPPSEQADMDTTRKLATISTIGFIAGGVLTAGGLVLVLTAPKRHDVALSVGPGSVNMLGAF